MRMPPTRWRSKKSVITACHTSPKPFAAVLISIAHASVCGAGSIRTSRLPDATTPTRQASDAVATRLPPSNRNCNRSMSALPIPKAFWRPIKPTRGAHEILDRPRREQIPCRVALVDAEVLGATDHASLTQLRDDDTIARKPDCGITGHAANRLLAFVVVAAQQQIGYALLGQDVRDVVAVDHDRRQRHVGRLGQVPCIEPFDERRLHVLAKRLDHLHDELAAARRRAVAAMRFPAGSEPRMRRMPPAARVGAHVRRAAESRDPS